MKKSIVFIFIGIIVIFLLVSLINNKSLFKSEPQIVVSSGTFSSGDTLSSILSDEGINLKDSDAISDSLQPQYDLRKIQPGNIYEVYKTTYNAIIQFLYKPNSIETYSITRSTITSDKFVCNKEALIVDKVITKTTGYIDTSLYEGMSKNKLPPELIMKFADIFSWQIDFLTETQQGDTFKLVYEQFRTKDKIVSEGKIYSAEYISKVSGKHFAIFFEYPSGETDYFDADGKSLKRLFLRAPLNFRRISSYFTYHRFHPILRYVRPHLGIDYSASKGTPVVSIGNGVVTFAGWHGGFGKQIIVRHNSTYSTYYGHLSRFAEKIRSGKYVKQGQVIGYVGATGMATGPHLDFRITVSGKFENFLKIKLPTTFNLNKKYLPQFNLKKIEQLKLLEN